MERKHTIDELRSVLKDLRAAIDALEAAAVITDKHRRPKLRQRLKEAKIQEAVILAKLAQVGVKV
jgi:hypothetical protein